MRFLLCLFVFLTGCVTMREVERAVDTYARSQYAVQQPKQQSTNVVFDSLNHGSMLMQCYVNSADKVIKFKIEDVGGTVYVDCYKGNVLVDKPGKHVRTWTFDSNMKGVCRYCIDSFGRKYRSGGVYE